MKTNEQNTENGNLNSLISKLKTKDTNYATLSKALQIIYIVFIPIYLVLTAIEYFSTHNINEIYGGCGFIGSFLIFIFTLGKYYKEYNFVDYSLPTVEMLKKAVARYQPFQKRTLWAVTAVAFMDAGLTFSWLDDNISILIMQIVFWGAMILAAIIGLVVWRIKYKPIRDEALQMIKEIESE